MAFPNPFLEGYEFATQLGQQASGIVDRLRSNRLARDLAMAQATAEGGAPRAAPASRAAEPYGVFQGRMPFRRDVTMEDLLTRLKIEDIMEQARVAKGGPTKREEFEQKERLGLARGAGAGAGGPRPMTAYQQFRVQQTLQPTLEKVDKEGRAAFGDKPWEGLKSGWNSGDIHAVNEKGESDPNGKWYGTGGEWIWDRKQGKSVYKGGTKVPRAAADQFYQKHQDVMTAPPAETAPEPSYETGPATGVSPENTEGLPEPQSRAERDALPPQTRYFVPGVGVRFKQ